MIAMSTNSVPWRARWDHVVAAVKSVPPVGRALLAVSAVTAAVGAVTGWEIVGIIGMGLAGAIVVGQEKK